jgi:hypothetical protein
MNIGFPNIIKHSSARKEKRSKMDLEEMGKTVAKLSTTMNEQEKK